MADFDAYTMIKFAWEYRVQGVIIAKYPKLIPNDDHYLIQTQISFLQYDGQ